MRYLDFMATGETPICTAEAAKLLPVNARGKYRSVRSIERYIRDGFGPAEARVFLEGAKVGNSYATSREAVQRFVRACSLGAASQVDERDQSLVAYAK